jgi:hypothetical protein
MPNQSSLIFPGFSQAFEKLYSFKSPSFAPRVCPFSKSSTLHRSYFPSSSKPSFNSLNVSLRLPPLAVKMVVNNVSDRIFAAEARSLA